MPTTIYLYGSQPAPNDVKLTDPESLTPLLTRQIQAGDSYLNVPASGGKEFQIPGGYFNEGAAVVAAVSSASGVVASAGFASGQVRATAALTGKCFTATFSTGQSKASAKLQGVAAAGTFTDATAKASAKLQGNAFVSAFAKGQSKAVSALAGKGFGASAAAGQSKAAGKLQSKTFSATFATGQTKAPVPLKGAAFASTSARAAAKASAALSGRVAVASFSAASPKAAGKLQSKVAIAWFAQGQAAATATLRGSAFTAAVALDKLTSTARLSGAASVSATIEGTLRGTAQCHGIAFISFFSGKLPSVAEVTPSPAPRVQIPGGPIRRHGLTRPIPQRVVIRATGQLIQAAHECHGRLTVTRRPVFTVAAELVQAAATMEATVRVISPVSAALKQLSHTAQGRAEVSTVKLDAEVEAVMAALLCLESQETEEDLCCK